MSNVDIILPIYNATDKVFAAIKSIQNQTYNAWQLIIIDDGSNNGCLESIKQVYENLEARIYYIKLEKNRRAAYARNYAISISNGKYISFIDQDDEWPIHKLEYQVEFLERTNFDAVHGNIIFIDNDSNIIWFKESENENNSRRLLEWNKISKVDLASRIIMNPNIRLISSMIKRDIFIKIGGFKDIFFGGEDELFWFEVAMNGKIGYIDKNLLYRREHNNNSVHRYRTHRLFGYINAIDYIAMNYPEISKSVIQSKKKELLFELLRCSAKTSNNKLFFYSLKESIYHFPYYLIAESTKLIQRIILRYFKYS